MVAVTALAVYVAQKLEAKAVLETKRAAQGCVSGSTQASAAGRRAATKEMWERIVSKRMSEENYLQNEVEAQKGNRWTWTCICATWREGLSYEEKLSPCIECLFLIQALQES